MKDTYICPKCSGERALKISQIADKAPGENGGILSIFARISDGGLGDRDGVGVFEA